MSKSVKRYIELCSTDEYTVVAFDVVNGTTRLSKYVGITILDKRGIPRMSEDGDYIKVKREEILNSKDAELAPLRRLAIGLKESQYREAMSNLRRGLQNSSKVLEDTEDRDIVDVYCEMYEIAMHSGDNKDEEGVEKVQLKPSAVWIRDNFMDELLECIDYQKGKTAFCKEIDHLGKLIGENIIEGNRGGKGGFSSNTTVKNRNGESIQRRYIRINKIDRLFKEDR